MSEEEFANIVEEEYKQVPEKYASKLQNVALLIEDDPSLEVRAAEGLEEGETLLGLYQGIPLTERGEFYGVGVTVPDTITIFRNPILKEAGIDPKSVRVVVRETLWHEIGHYFGLDEQSIDKREIDGTNTYQ
jgi:predicted Zn-dependent protease with MMP-like domain